MDSSKWIRRLLVLACPLLAGFLLAAAPATATEEIAEQNALDCMTCHPDDEDCFCYRQAEARDQGSRAHVAVAVRSHRNEL